MEPVERRLHAIKALVDNARAVSEERMSEVEAWESPPSVRVVPYERCLPGYAPYVGSSYFEPANEGYRTLIYGLSQNVRPDSEFAGHWARDYYE